MADKCTNIRVPEELWAELKAIAEAEDRTIHSVIRRALREFLDRQNTALEGGV